MLSLYRGALSLAKAGAIPKEIFKIDYSIARELATAVLSVIDAKIVLIEDRSRTGADSDQRTPLNDLIEEAEEYILSNFIF